MKKSFISIVIFAVAFLNVFTVFASTNYADLDSNKYLVKIVDDFSINVENKKILTLLKNSEWESEFKGNYYYLSGSEYILPKEKIEIIKRIEKNNESDKNYQKSKIRTIDAVEELPLYRDEKLKSQAGILHQNSQINILNETEDYYQVLIGNQHLYVPKIKNNHQNVQKQTIDEKQSLQENVQSYEKKMITFSSQIKNFKVLKKNVTVYDNSGGRLQPVGWLEQGEVYPIERILGNWIEIQFGDKKGYVWKEATEPSLQSPSKTGNANLNTNIYFNSVQNLSVYDNSTGKLIPYGKIKKGVSYPIIKQTGDWLEILFAGRIGYVYKTGYSIPFSSQVKYFEVMLPNVTVYDNSSGRLQPVGWLEQGEKYPIGRIMGNWIEIQFGDKKGYLRKEATEPSLNVSGKLGNANLNSIINLKASQDLPVYDNSTGKLIPYGKIKKGVSYPIIKQTGDWIEILFAGRIGYVYKSGYTIPFTEKTKYFTVTQPNVIVYDNSTGKLIPVGALEKQETYSIKRIVGNWIEIQFGNKKGYVWKESTEPSLRAPRKTGQETLNSNVYFKASEELSVYDNSLGKLIKFGSIKKGMTYPIIKKTGNWYEIVYAGRIGYVYATGVILQFSNSIKYFETTQSKVQIVQNKNGRHVKIGELIKGHQYERLRDLGNWHEVQVGDKIGYIWKEATKPVLSSTYKNRHKGTVNSPFHLEVVADATVYDNTSGKLVPFATLLKGTVYPYYEKMGNWYKVSVLGRDGYIYGSAVKQVVKDLVNPNQIYTYDQMVKDIDELKNTYPGLIQAQIIGRSVDGRNIYAIKLGKGNVEIFLNGAHHAREYITTNLLMEMIDTYSQAFVKGTKVAGYSVSDLLNKTSIWFVPMVNPDGVTLVQKGHTSAKNQQFVLMLNGYKKDFSAWKANIRGVDLNRQYPADWANIKNNPGKPAFKDYKGPRPLSEPEAYAVYQFTNRHDFKTAVAYHSSGEILYWNFHQDSTRYNRDHAIAKMIQNKTGYRLVYPGPNPSGGGFTDWFILTHKKPSFTPEVSPYVGERPVPLSNFSRIWYQNYSIGLMLADEAYRNRNNR